MSSEVPYGTLDLMVLKTLAGMGPQHGYGIARRSSRRRRRVALNQGAIYPALLRPRAEGLDQERLGHQREQPARPLLRPHREPDNGQLGRKRERRFRRRTVSFGEPPAGGPLIDGHPHPVVAASSTWSSPGGAGSAGFEEEIRAPSRAATNGSGRRMSTSRAPRRNRRSFGASTDGRRPTAMQRGLPLADADQQDAPGAASRADRPLPDGHPDEGRGGLRQAVLAR